jgi:hypothetical protein
MCLHIGFSGPGGGPNEGDCGVSCGSKPKIKAREDAS